MDTLKNHVIWFDVHLFLLPCVVRAAMADLWLSENPHDIAEFKKCFPDAISTAGLLPNNEALEVSMCSVKCTRHAECLLPENANATLHVDQNSIVVSQDRIRPNGPSGSFAIAVGVATMAYKKHAPH